MRWLQSPGIAFLLIIVVTAAQVALTAEEKGNEGRGKQWVRSHPFYISGLTQVDDRYEVDAYRGAGLNTLLAWKPREGLFEKSVSSGMPWHYHIHRDRYGKTPQEIIAHAKAFVEKYPGCTGFMFGDEPDQAAMEQVGAMCAALRGAFPDKLVYSNAFPIGATADRYFGGDAPENYGYSEYFDAFAQQVGGDVVMFDIYPFGDGDGHSGVYFLNLNVVRDTALRHDVPYWTFIQSYQNTGNRRLPSESDLRMQIFTSLAYGFTGISYFTYDVAFERGLVELDATPSPLYAHAAKVNPEVAHLGKALRFFTSTGVGYISGQSVTEEQTLSNPLPPGTRNWKEVEARPGEIQDIRMNYQGEEKDALIGYFKDDADIPYFMIVNLWHGADKSAAACTQTIMLTFAPNVTFLTRLSRETGQPENLPVQAGKLELILPGGTGDLFSLGTGSFPE
jgi:hypothetical protein